MKPPVMSPVFLLLLIPQVLSEVPTVTLLNAAKPGIKMPVAGIGTWGYVHTPGTGFPGEVWNDTVAEKAVSEWIMLGGRRIDSALDYHDQVGVGKAIESSGVARKELFVTSKLTPEGYNETFKQMDQILGELQVDYVDLLLIHWPGLQEGFNSSDPACQGNPPTWRNCRQSIWKALEMLFNSSKALAIGVSNFEKNHLEDIFMMNSLTPSVNQVEYHPYWHEDDIVANYPGLTGRLPVFLAFPGLPPVYSIAIEFPGYFLELLHKPT